jgi:hypothetical protein
MRAGFAALVLGLTAGTLSASIGPPVPIEDRARGAARIVVASIVDVQSRFDVNEYGDRLIVTDATMRVEETLKGPDAVSLLVTVDGGAIGDLALEVSDMPAVKAGDRAVFFLTPSSGGGHRLHRRGLGMLPLDGLNRVPQTTLTLGEVRRLVRAGSQ